MDKKDKHKSKTRANKYEKKLKVDATFDEILELMVSKPPEKKGTVKGYLIKRKKKNDDK